jgi:hypothetical protein
MDHVQWRLKYENMVLNNSNDVCYCYYIDVNHASLSSSGKKEKNNEREKNNEKTFFAQ